MNKARIEITPEFIELAPAVLEEGILYISMVHGGAVHKCCCGCGEKVVTPFTPTDWKLIFDGASVSLFPSIGNWNFSCQSHYWIENNKIKWAEKWSRKRIKAAKEEDLQLKEMYFGVRTKSDSLDGRHSKDNKQKGWFSKLKSRWIQ